VSSRFGPSRSNALTNLARKELEAYLDCGLLCRGFARLKCEDCDRP